MGTASKQQLKKSQGVTLRDIAAQANVHVGSVSSVLNGAKSNTRVSQEMRNRILKIAEELHYRPNPHAQRLVQGRNERSIGLFALLIDEGIAAQKVLAIQMTLQQQGYYVPIHAYGHAGAGSAQTQLAMLDELCRQQPRAVVCSSPGLVEEALAELRLFQQRGGLVVTYDQQCDLDCDQVIFDRRGAELAVRHLSGLGHLYIGMCLHGTWSEDDPQVQKFRRALEEAGLIWRPDWMFSGGNYEEGGARLAQWWLQLPEKDRPTALFIINDRTASSFEIALHHAGRQVPRDVSIVGFDNALVSSFSLVPLTTVSHPAETIGRLTAQLVLDRLEADGNLPPQRVVVSSELVRRESTTSPARI